MARADIPETWLYPADMTAAAAVQRELADRVIHAPLGKTIAHIAGVDVSNNLYDPAQQIYAAIVRLAYPALTVMETATTQETCTMPYIPGFLAFREVPALITAYDQLKTKPDLIMVDGHGISHPRGLGIASHLGVLLDCPTIGVAKSILVGQPQGILGPEPGDRVPLVWRGKTIGMVLRSKRRTNPLYIAVGHKITLDEAVTWVLNCLTRYRLPETTRQAHLAANVCRQKAL